MVKHSCKKKKKIGQKFENVQEFTITEKKLHQTDKKRKN